MRKFLGLVMGFGLAMNAHASSLTIRDMKLLGNGKIEIQLDGTAPKDSLEIEYVRDIVQFSIQNATIYPAKIMHADETQAFTKVFAYQYAPNLVRVRFSVDGKADQFQNKVKWEQKGKLLTVTFPAGAIKTQAKKEKAPEAEHERSLLAKVLGQSKPEPKVEKIEDAQVESVKPAKVELTKSEAKTEAKAEAVKAEAKAETIREENSENLPVLQNDKKKSSETASKLGGAKQGPSAVRAFLAMFLVVGGLGLVLLYVKKKKGQVQARKVGNSWVSNLLSGNKKSKALIEVVAVHALGPKQSITIVKIRGQALVLGVTEGNVQLITQLDSDDEIDLLEDPKVADSIGKIFGGKPRIESTSESTKNIPAKKPVSTEVSFGNLLKNSSGAGAIVARNAYQAQKNPGIQTQTGPRVSQPVAATSISTPLQSGVRDQIKQRLQGMRN